LWSPSRSSFLHLTNCAGHRFVSHFRPQAPEVGLHSGVEVEDDRLAWWRLARARGFAEARVQEPAGRFDS
jgi:hypothetical protein